MFEIKMTEIELIEKYAKVIKSDGMNVCILFDLIVEIKNKYTDFLQIETRALMDGDPTHAPQAEEISNELEQCVKCVEKLASSLGIDVDSEIEEVTELYEQKFDSKINLILTMLKELEEAKNENKETN